MPKPSYFFCHSCAPVIRWLGLLGLMLLAGVASAQAPLRAGMPEIEYGYPDQSVFVATTNAKGQPDSPMTRLAEVLMDRVGLSWHAVSYPAPRLFSNLQNGTTNFSILVRGSSLEACCIFSRKPVYSTTLNVYSIGNKPPVKSKDDLAGKHIITIRGYSYAGLLKFISDPANRIDNQPAGTHKAAFEMLKAGRADYVVDYASAAGDILAESPIADLRANPIDQLDIYLVLSKSYPEAEKLMARLEDIVRTLDVDALLHGRALRK
jgi:polar amino acid transport system substrate-binding protein